MRKASFVIIVILASFVVATCRKQTSPPAAPNQAVTRKPLPVFGVMKKSVAGEGDEDTTITVKMRIVGMSILDTKRDNDPFFLLVPEIRDHQAFILAHRDYKMTGTMARPPVGEPAAAPKYDVLLLNDDELSIDPAPVEPLRYTIAGGSCPLFLTDLQSLRWTPSISDAVGKTVTINPKFTRPNHPEKAGLAARLKIARGDLYASAADHGIWQFKTAKNLSSGHIQMLATVVVHEYSLPAGTTKLTINTRDFASTGASTLLATLEPDANNEIVFTIGTTEPSQRLPGTGTVGDEDTHYPHLYDVVVDTAGGAVSSTIRPFRVPGARCSPQTTTLVNCGPGRP